MFLVESWDQTWVAVHFKWEGGGGGVGGGGGTLLVLKTENIASSQFF